MKIVVLFLSLIITMPVANAHNVKIKGASDRDSKYISFCNDKYYGYHKQNSINHWHEVVFDNNEWKVVNPKEIFENDPCITNDKTKVSLVKCVDGDTAVLKMDDEEIKVRFLAVDTPESVHPTKNVEIYAKEASKNTCDLLTNASSIFVEYDSNSDKTDKYGRQLAWIWIDDILLQELMVSEGFARVSYIYGEYKYLDSLCNLQHQAFENKKGIWQYDYEYGYCDTKKINISNTSQVKKIYEVSFKNGDNIKKMTVAEGMSVKEISANSRVGYKFLGWYNGDNKYDFSKPVTSNITLNAKYCLDYNYIILIIFVLFVGFVNKNRKDKNGKNNKKNIKYNRKKRI